MPIIDFLNETSLQDYPLQPNQTFGLSLDNAWLADANFVLGFATTYDYSTDGALTKIVGTVTDVTFTFTIGSVLFDLVVPRSAAPGYTANANGRVSTTTSSKYGFGYIQIGNISSIGNGTWTGTAKLEPTTIITLTGHQVNSINVANTDPTTITEKCVQYYANGTVDGSVALFNNGSTIPAGNYLLQYAGGAMRYGSTTRFKWDVGVNPANWQFTNSGGSSLMNLPFLIQSSGWRSQTECEAANAQARSSNASAISLAGGVYGIKLVDAPYNDNFPGMPNPTWELIPTDSVPASSSDNIANATSVKTDITGDVLLVPGRFSTVTLDTAATSVTFGYVDSAEEGGVLPCDGVSLIYPSGLPGPECKDLLYTVNGVGPNETNNTLNLVGSRGIAVVPTVDGHGLRVELSPLILFKSNTDPDCASSSMGASCEFYQAFSSSPVILGQQPSGSFTSSWSSWVPSTTSSSSLAPGGNQGGYNPFGNWKMCYFSPTTVGRDCFVQSTITHNPLDEVIGSKVRDAFKSRIAGSAHGICPSSCSTYGTWPGPEFQLTTYQDPVFRSGVIAKIGFNAGYDCAYSSTAWDDAQWECRMMQFIENSYDALLPSSSYWRRNQHIDGTIAWFGDDGSGGPGFFEPGTYLLRYERGAYSRGPNPANSNLEYCVIGYEIIVRGINGSDFAYGPAPCNFNEPYYGWASSDQCESTNVGLAERVENLVTGPIGMRLRTEYAKGNQLIPAAWSSAGYVQTPRFILYKASDYPGTNEAP